MLGVARIAKRFAMAFSGLRCMRCKASFSAKTEPYSFGGLDFLPFMFFFPSPAYLGLTGTHRVVFQLGVSLGSSIGNLKQPRIHLT